MAPLSVIKYVNIMVYDGQFIEHKYDIHYSFNFQILFTLLHY